MTTEKKAGIAPGLSFFVRDADDDSGGQFNEDRFGGVAGHDLTSVS